MYSANTSLAVASCVARFRCIIALPLTGRHRQRIDPPDHAPEQPPWEMALGQHQSVVSGVLDQPAASSPAAAAGQQPAADLLRQGQPPSKQACSCAEAHKVPAGPLWPLQPP